MLETENTKLKETNKMRQKICQFLKEQKVKKFLNAMNVVLKHIRNQY